MLLRVYACIHMYAPNPKANATRSALRVLRPKFVTCRIGAVGVKLAGVLLLSVPAGSLR